MPDNADTVLTLAGTNLAGVAGTITVIADDGGAGGRPTPLRPRPSPIHSNDPPFIYPKTVTNLVAPVNKTLTNFINALELDSCALYWFAFGLTDADYEHRRRHKLESA